MYLERNADAARISPAGGDWRENWCWNQHAVHYVGQLPEGKYYVTTVLLRHDSMLI